MFFKNKIVTFVAIYPKRLFTFVVLLFSSGNECEALWSSGYINCGKCLAVKKHLGIVCFFTILSSLLNEYWKGPFRESHPEPLAPEAKIIPPDQQADRYDTNFSHLMMKFPLVTELVHGLWVLRLLYLSILDEVYCDWPAFWKWSLCGKLLVKFYPISKCIQEPITRSLQLP